MGKPSIITTKKCCIFCGSMRNVETHHAMHGPNRKKADEDGLVVPLCRMHHIELHHGADGHKLDESIKRKAQYAWMKTYGKTVEEWRERYGRNYLD